MTKPPPFAASFSALCAALDSPEDRWTDLRLANALGTTPTQIWRWRAGKQTPDVVKQEGLIGRLKTLAREAKKRPKPS